MKKVLFATTALVATAGYASADVTLSGVAQMGLQGGDGIATTQFVQDIDVTFTMSGTTDNGLTFGASIDLDENAAGVGADDAGATIFISGDFGTLTMGDTDGALDWALTEAWVGNAGSINDDETAHAGALGSYLDGAYDGQILRYDYAIGDFGIALSVEMDDADLRDHGYAIGFRYGLDLGAGSLDLGLGYQTATYASTAAGLTIGNGGVDIEPGFGVPGLAGLVGYQVEVDAIGVSAVYESNGLSVGLSYTTFDADYADGSGDMDHVGVGVGYTIDAITVSANWGQYDGDFSVGATNYNIDQTGYGLAAAYDLGGGLSAHLGYGSSEYDGSTTQVDADTWSFGLSMSF